MNRKTKIAKENADPVMFEIKKLYVAIINIADKIIDLQTQIIKLENGRK